MAGFLIISISLQLGETNKLTIGGNEWCADLREDSEHSPCCVVDTQSQSNILLSVEKTTWKIKLN